MNNTQRYALPAERLPEAVRRLFDLSEQVIAPAGAPRGDIFYQPVDSADEIQLDFGIALVSPVQYLLPAAEVLFEYRQNGDGSPQFSAPATPPERIIFGIRPCDIAAIQYLDQFYMEREPVDTLYAARREATTLIALACAEPAADTCFCSCCEGGGPVAEGGFDVQLSPVGDQYLVEVATEKGQQILQQWQDLLEPASEELVAARDAQMRRAIEEQLQTVSNLAAAIRRISADRVNPETWETIGHDCYSCGGCSYLCPVCTCYDVVDIKYDDNSGTRIRRVDSCRLGGFTREATGHIPRPTPASRARWYAYHKLSYDYHQERDRYGCVGCGRCIITCLGEIGMPRVCELVRQPEAEKIS